MAEFATSNEPTKAKKEHCGKGISEAKKSGDEERAQAILSEVASLGAEISKLEAETQEAIEQRDQIQHVNSEPPSSRCSARCG